MTGHDLAEVDAVAPAQDRVVGRWRPRAARRGPPTRTTRASSAKNGGKLAQVAQREPARGAVDVAVAEGEPQHVGEHTGDAAPIGAQHAVGQVDADRLEACGRELAAQVAGAPGEVEHDRAAGQRELVDGAPPPADVHPERHDAVHEVVARGDGVEHRPHRGGLLLALGQWRVTARDARRPHAIRARSERRRSACSWGRHATSGARTPDTARRRSGLVAAGERPTPACR